MVLTKLRRSEGFLLTLPAAVSTGSGRRALWMHAAIPIQFSYAGSSAPAIDPAWIEALLRAADTAKGLQPLAEPAPGPAQSARVA
uniref:DUF7882 family protein n=1 Tax=Rathayibacter sp. VKM Ac-2630 TaxID=1938617 RepID=UPI00191C3717|nr:hypothetical protein [Rathayibacter sp. VKM Ac-2630]